jgi:hypothetical protein
MTRRLAFLVALAIAAVVALGGARTTQAHYTACCGNLRLLYSNGDAFRNYDFYDYVVSSTGVDWPVTLLFYHNAEVDRIKDAMSGRGYTHGGITIHGRLSDDGGATFVWDDDGGKKQGSDQTAFYHFRLYANPATDRNYSPGWGFYVFGTTHQDYQECCGGWHGESEQAETHIAADAGLAFGVSPAYDNANFYNYEPFRLESGDDGLHRWRNSGRATYVYVP